MIKVAIVGDRGAGSQSLARTFDEGKFRDVTNMAGDSVYFKTIDVDGNPIQIQFETIDPVRNTRPKVDGVMFVYDVTNRISFENLREGWIPNINKYVFGYENMGRIIVGSKAEMNSKREVSKWEGKEYADSIGVPFFEVSARTGYNVTDAFTQLARETIPREKSKHGPIDLTPYRGEEQLTSKCTIS